MREYVVSVIVVVAQSLEAATFSMPTAPVSKPLMVLLHQLGSAAKKDVIPRIEKALIDLPGASFLFPPERDSYPGWLFIMTFLRGLNALPDATKQRHSPFHLWIERVPAPVAS